MTYGRLFTLFTEQFGYWPTKARCSKLPYKEAKEMCSKLYNFVKPMDCYRAEKIRDILCNFTRTKNGELQKILYKSLCTWYGK